MIKIRSLSKTFRQFGRETNVLRDITLDVRKGECVVIGGMSGSGKTTLLNIIGCLARPSAGEVVIDKKNISRLPDHFLCELRRDNIGFIFQQFNLLAGYTTLENIGMPLLPLGMSEAERDAIVEPLLAFMGIADKADLHVNRLSGGEQQRVAIARALVNDPDIVIADEPISNLDADTAERVIEIFVKLINKGKTIIMTSHDRLLTEHLLVTSRYDLIDGRLK